MRQSNKFCERLRLPLFLNSFSISVEVADSVRKYPWSGFGDASCADLVDVRATSCRAGQGRPRVCPARVSLSSCCVPGLLFVVPACPGLLCEGHPSLQAKGGQLCGHSCDLSGVVVGMIRTQNNAKNWWSGHDQQAGEQVRVKIERESRKWRTVRLAETRSRVTKWLVKRL